MKKNNGRGNDLVRVIIQPASVFAGRDIDNELPALAGRNVRKFRQLGFRVANMSANAALALAERPEVAHVSLDREVRTLGHVSYTTGADYARTDDGANTGVDGTGIGIAVLDSGIDNNHKSFLDKNNYLRVVVNRDFTARTAPTIPTDMALT
jgi:subtilisin family serine protease